MSVIYTVSLKKLIDAFKLEIIHLPKEADEIKISSADINRPGLHLAGFFEFYDRQRIQIIGKAETGYLENLDPQTRQDAIRGFMALKPPVVIVARGLHIFDEMMSDAKEFGVALLRTNEGTSTFSSSLISTLNVELAPRVTRHGVLVEVYGEGILLLGESGVGKSETAIELIKRGHRLIADDAVEIRRVSSKTLVGSSPANIRHFLEVRGIGIINARRIFGMGSIKVTEKIDMVIQLENWDATKVYDRMGMENEYTEILGIDVPSLTIPVKPGRNLAIIIEVAAMNNRQKKMGYNAAYELLEKLGMSEGIPKVTTVDWDAY
ncbi:HPr(Ser) kinase/phosphatase [Candidatus Soleaferrea massiliensis]|uniref:HPr(Ser) kinase/phosphatase n=1 Tax=Candidatus Soleaferrea massiliensis TaxID=1470354 RepID=UPI00058E7A27|nr:HPr(Ser) kinase/phosphatase [Candidatus Soleaferrea massiliensis]